MKRNFVRNLVMAVLCVVVLGGCGKQVAVVEDNSNSTILNWMEKPIYTPTDEELQWAYLMAAAQAYNEEALIQTMLTNVAINRAKAEGISLIDVFTAPNQFSAVHDGVPCICTRDEDGNVTWGHVTEDMLTDELKKAVDVAFLNDYTHGALYYYNCYYNTRGSEPKEFIQEGDWIFFKEF